MLIKDLRRGLAQIFFAPVTTIRNKYPLSQKLTIIRAD